MSPESLYFNSNEAINFNTINIIRILFLSTVFGICAKIYFSVLRKNPRMLKYVDKFPGPTPLPLVGNALSLVRPHHELLDYGVTNWLQKYGRCFRVWLGNRAYIVFAEASSVEKILASNVHIDKSEDYDAMHNWLGTGLLTSSGKKWHSRRKLLTPSFHFKILEDFIHVFNEQSKVLVEIFDTECSDGKKFDIFPYLTRCTLDIICETAMGKNIHAQNDRELEYSNAVYGMCDILSERILRPWLRINWIWKLSSHGRAEKKYLKVIHRFSMNVIAERKRERQQQLEQKVVTNGSEKETSDEDSVYKKKRRLAFLDLLLDVSNDGKVLSDLDIREETDTFMFEGHDTTSASLGWTLFLLSCYPEFQRKVQKELDEIFYDDRNRPITSIDISKMKYLECCIKEALRLYPSVPIFSREMKDDCVLNSGLLVPKGSVAVIVPYCLHRDEKNFPDSEVFNPERFTQENSIGRNAYAYIPFSAGPRNCIGQKFAMMEEKVILANVLRNFNLEAAERREDVMIIPDAILRPKNGLHVKLTKRQ